MKKKAFTPYIIFQRFQRFCVFSKKKRTGSCITGFTLIELLVVVAILSLILSIILVSLADQRQRARIAKGLQFSQSLHHTLGDQAVGIWNFDDSADLGQALDTSGHGNHGIIHGASYTADTPTGRGHALSFNASGHYVLTESFGFDYNYITISVWIKGERLTQRETILGQGGVADAPHLEVGAGNANDSNRVTVIVDNIWIAETSTRPLETNKWFHVVYTKRGPGANQAIYVNGVSEPLRINASRTFSSTVSTKTIGQRRNNSQWFRGIISEVRIYEKALELSQIEALYYVGLDNLLAKGLISEQEHKERL